MTANTNQQSNATLLRMPAVSSMVGLSRGKIYQLIRDGRFPAGVPIAAHTTAWVSIEVESWIKAKIAARDAATTAGGAA